VIAATGRGWSGAIIENGEDTMQTSAFGALLAATTAL
jgi:hypothetical protein